MTQSSQSMDYVSRHDSPVGLILAGWRVGRLCRLALPDSEAAEQLLRLSLAVDSELSPKSRKISGGSFPRDYSWLTNDLQEALDRFFEAKPHGFDWNRIELGRVTDFQHRVLFRCYQMLPGETFGYGELAAIIGSAGAARAVGQVMANNRHPLLIPCHRVVASGAKIGGFSAPGGLQTKQWLLQREGVVVENARSKSRAPRNKDLQRNGSEGMMISQGLSVSS